MSSDSVTIALDGNPTLDDLTKALSGLRDLLSALTQTHARGAEIAWVVEALAAGSAEGTFRGSAQQEAVVWEVTRAYLDVGKTLTRGEPLTQPRVHAAAQKITEVLNGRVPSLRFETADDDVLISSVSRPAQPTQSEIPGSFGAVLGRIQTVSNRGSLRFVLYDLLYDKAVSCYLQAGQEGIMRNAWDRIALVRGWIRRDPATGRPITVRRISDVEIRPEGVPGAWRTSIGVLRPFTTDEPAEATVRRIRDAN